MVCYGSDFSPPPTLLLPLLSTFLSVCGLPFRALCRLLPVALGGCWVWVCSLVLRSETHLGQKMPGTVQREFKLSDQAVKDFQRDGFVVIPAENIFGYTNNGPGQRHKYPT